jgi:hypothetical protein
MRITFANDTTADGREFKAGSSAEIDNSLARSLIVRGKAVEADTPSRPATRKKKPASAGTNSATAETNAPSGEKGKE